jgi:hypothetical protein
MLILARREVRLKAVRYSTGKGMHGVLLQAIGGMMSMGDVRPMLIEEQQELKLCHRSLCFCISDSLNFKVFGKGDRYSCINRGFNSGEPIPQVYQTYIHLGD